MFKIFSIILFILMILSFSVTGISWILGIVYYLKNNVSVWKAILITLEIGVSSVVIGFISLFGSVFFEELHESKGE